MPKNYRAEWTRVGVDKKKMLVLNRIVKRILSNWFVIYRRGHNFMLPCYKRDRIKRISVVPRLQ